MGFVAEDQAILCAGSASSSLIPACRLHRDLKICKQNPYATKHSILAERFDNIFGQRGQYEKLGQLLASLHTRKGDLLRC
ncbi:hypothetical protein ACFOM8_22080 [Paracoccus angustae]|uniref:Uncharacterized protein n=1 Tax=Paracoccus angustae TaxID=1671480 RepID=A0ABV7UB34_9RHOB